MNKRNHRLDDAIFRDAEGTLATDLYREEEAWKEFK